MTLLIHVDGPVCRLSVSHASEKAIVAYIALNKMERFEKVPHGRYINFVAEFLAADKRVTRAEAIASWTELKELDVPRTTRPGSRRERSAGETAGLAVAPDVSSRTAVCT